MQAPVRLPLAETTVCLDLPEGWERLTPATEVGLSLAEVRMLLRAVLPQPVFDPRAALALLDYQHRRKAAAYRSHRQRRLRRLHELRSGDLSL